MRDAWPEGPDWMWWKAQLFQESRLDRFAVSPVGARGLCQVMPATGLDWVRAWFPKQSAPDPHDAAFCIVGGAKYMRQLQRFKAWANLPIEVRVPFSQAAYNAGMGWISKAKARCRAVTWDATAPCLEALTGRANARQTKDYVIRIGRWYRELQQLPPWLDVPCIWAEHRGGCGPVR